MDREQGAEFVIIGSGFGGAFAAFNLAQAGRDVLVVERGVWAERDESCWDEVRLHLRDPLYRGQVPLQVDQKDSGTPETVWTNDTVGGSSVFYGAAAYRLRESDFLGAPLPGSAHRDPSTRWPLAYDEMEPFYAQAEALQGVAGIAGQDVTEPPRSGPFTQEPPPLTAPARRIWEAAEALGLHPSNIPLAINFDGNSGKGTCILCHTCDHFACKLEAKNDLSIGVLPAALASGAKILTESRAVRIDTTGGRATSVEVVHQSTGEKTTIRADHVIVACGALASPHLLLASGIRSEGGGGDLMGRYLMRHVNGVVSAALPRKANPELEFHKMITIPDFYHGPPEGEGDPPGPWGILQDLHTPGKGVIKAHSPWGLRNIAATISRSLINLLCIGEDVPQRDNRVYLDASRTDRFGMPALSVFHRYAPRDLAVRRALAGEAKKVLRGAGALPIRTSPIETFSHAFGTCRFGTDPETSVLDPDCLLWGYENLFVLDSSFMPSGGSVNPSLTIGANALRVTKNILDR